MADIDFLRKYSTTLVESAIHLLGVRPRDSGVLRPAMPMRSPQLGCLVGYAVTALVSADAAEKEGKVPNVDFWNFVYSRPGPKAAILSDASPAPGITGAACGRLTAKVLQACGCRGAITNGGVRDIEEIDATGFSVFSSHLTVAHGNPHVIHFGRPVQIQNLTITTGDVVCADRHGAILIPPAVLPHLQQAILEVERRVSPVLSYCDTSGFSPQGVAEQIEQHMRKAPRWTPKG